VRYKSIHITLQYLQKIFCNDKKKLKGHGKCKKNINECKNDVLYCQKNCNLTDWLEKSDGIYVLHLLHIACITYMQ
jgi:hypothetical protein